MELKGKAYLRRKLDGYRTGVQTRYKYYSMEKFDNTDGITIPAQIRDKYKAVLGWATKAVDSLADRLIFREFANDNFNINDIFQYNNPDIFFDSAILSALIGSCCFIYVSKDEEGMPRLQVIEASNATGIIDPITNLLTEGYAVLKRDDYDKPLLEAYFTPNETIFYPKGEEPYSIENPTGIPLLVPIINRPDASRPFGRSRITKSGISYQKTAQRTIERSEITAEFYSFPQKYALGVSQDAESVESIKATISSFIMFTKDDDGDKPSVGQFTTASMTPFVEQLKMAASGFAGETGLTMDDLGFSSDNPSSVEAIKASHENLRLAGKAAHRSIGSGLLNVAYVAVCLRDDFRYMRKEFMKAEVKWEPLFEADASTLTMLGDGAIKVNQVLPGYITAETIRDLTGIKGNMEAKPVQEAQEQKVKVTDDASDKQKNRIISTYEITSLLSNYQKGVLSKENGIALLASTGMSEKEAEFMLNNTKVEGKDNE